MLLSTGLATVCTSVTVPVNAPDIFVGALAGGTYDCQMARLDCVPQRSMLDTVLSQQSICKPGHAAF
jgi:hypothetical protein